MTKATILSGRDVCRARRLVGLRLLVYRARSQRASYGKRWCFRYSMVARVGAPATICRKPRQARKGAAVAADSGAGVSLARAATLVRALA